MSGEADRNLQTYQDVLKKVYSIYGDVQRHHPLRASKMQLTMNPDSLSHELRVRSYSRNAWEKTRYFLMMMLKNLAGIYLLRGNLDTKAVRWSRYRDELVENTDFRKFDGMLRMVIDGNDQQFMELQSYLEGMFREKQLAYGMHQSGEALVTCLVHSYTGSHAFCGREQWRLRYGCTATQAADCQSKKRKTSKVDIGGVNATRGLLIHCPDRCRHPALPDPNAEPLTRQTPAPPRPATFRERQQVLLEFSIFTASDDT